ncbi:MAG: PilZ domain-containing protein [Planctomycetota bacterium]
MNANKMTQKRKSTRFQVRHAQVGWSDTSWFGFNAPLRRPHPLVNMSLKGLQLLSTSYVPKDKKVDIAIDCPAYVEPIVCRATVRWCRKVTSKFNGYQVGFEFLKFKGGSIEKLRKLSNDTMIRTVARGQMFVGC